MSLSGPPLQTKQREMQYRALRAEAALAGTSLTQVHMQPEFYSFHVLGVKCMCVFLCGWLWLRGTLSQVNCFSISPYMPQFFFLKHGVMP